MSGHSKWHSIKHKKAASDSKMAKIFTRHAKLIMIAARDGGGDPDTNPGLRGAIQNAKSENMPNNNIDRAIKRGTGALDEGKEISEIYYEGYGTSGVALYIHVITDNKNRSVASVRSILSKNGGNMGEAGCVGWMFENKGMITVELAGKDPEEAQLELIEAGADDFDDFDDQLLVYCNRNDVQTVADGIEKLGYKVTKKELTYEPKQTVAIDEQAAADKILRLIDVLEEDDDVQSVFMNAVFGDAIE